ncbi:hypothetical protein ADK67_37335 [Saccharothrix sp. NRRL B-16348]|nr:hypothetical protein ADK67_37335 [Saccharothrix sp. NRRL B-16348]
MMLDAVGVGVAALFPVQLQCLACGWRWWFRCKVRAAWQRLRAVSKSPRRAVCQPIALSASASHTGWSSAR